MLRNAFYIYYNCLSNYIHKKNRDNNKEFTTQKKVLIDYCSCFSYAQTDQ